MPSAADIVTKEGGYFRQKGTDRRVTRPTTSPPFASFTIKFKPAMKAKTRVRIIFLTLTALAVGFPLLFLTAPPVPHPVGPEVIAISFVENLTNANFDEARKLVTPESVETVHLFETLVGSQSDELKSEPTHFTVSRSEMNATQDTLFIDGKLFFSNKHKIIRRISLVLVYREGRWLVDCHDNNIF
ncbi:hypothetical protein B5F38_01270 [Barnesiella sp. An22]|nr:hypothetical protein B5F38_01270 [Barnesiella sp. An22]